ncbi:ABC transporter permease [Sporanaerobium hydrogeniformans]|uniref:ABC transporter permease n=1 Tax=Sporanaerobium hydrogeniformans TaxID=3072179 RepID=A0AC61D7V3_9FIRM|nr:carbohydrate ABC transporter permease [Sporanaerobium hydrogeniformans]PHV69579.1 ABC transporter permease [Sporanaerobium hydrogeniformans]
MKKTLQNIIKQIVCIFLSLIVIAPFYMVVINSFKTKGEAARMSLRLPTEWVFDNYIQVIEKGKLLRGFSNSLLYAVVATVIAILGCAMAAYIISRRKTKFNQFVYYFILCGLFVPINYVTLAAVLKGFGLADTRLGMIIAFTSSMIPFCTFTIRNFMVSIPVELDEAGVIDGAGPVSLFFSIIIPLLKPILVTAFILEFMAVWSDFMTPLYLSSKSATWPMNLAVYNFFGKNQQYWNYVFADIVLTCLPVIIVYLLGQRYIVSGMTSGAVKE